MTIVLAALGLGIIGSIVGGALGGVIVGGKHIGNELAALMGSFYGPIAGISGVIVGIVALQLLQA